MTRRIQALMTLAIVAVSGGSLRADEAGARENLGKYLKESAVQLLTFHGIKAETESAASGQLRVPKGGRVEETLMLPQEGATYVVLASACGDIEAGHGLRLGVLQEGKWISLGALSPHAPSATAVFTMKGGKRATLRVETGAAKGDVVHVAYVVKRSDGDRSVDVGESIAASSRGPVWSRWDGLWKDDEGFVFSCTLYLKIQGKEADGVILWTARNAAPHRNYEDKIDHSGFEYVQGVFDGATRKVELTGQKVSDDKLLGLDVYRLSISERGATFEGVTKGNENLWNCPLYGEVRFLKDTGANGLDGSYVLTDWNDPTGKTAARVMFEDEKEGRFMVIGLEQDWSGRGSLKGRTGSYDWKFSNGKTGQTFLVVTEDGSLRGHVSGSGLDWHFVARRKQ